MKHPLISLFALSLGLNTVWVAPTLAINPTQRSFTPVNPTLYAQRQNVETLLQQAFQYTQQGRPQQAIETLQQVLGIAQQQGDKGNEATAYLGLGFNYDNIGQSQEALKYYNQALPIFKEVGDRRGEAAILNKIGEVYQGIGQPQEALKYYNQALPIAKETGNRPLEATIIENIEKINDNN